MRAMVAQLKSDSEDLQQVNSPVYGCCEDDSVWFLFVGVTVFVVSFMFVSCFLKVFVCFSGHSKRVEEPFMAC